MGLGVLIETNKSQQEMSVTLPTITREFVLETMERLNITPGKPSNEPEKYPDVRPEWPRENGLEILETKTDNKRKKNNKDTEKVKQAKAEKMAEKERVKQEKAAEKVAEKERVKQEKAAEKMAEKERVKQEKAAEKVAEKERVKQEKAAEKVAEKERVKQEKAAEKVAEKKRVKHEKAAEKEKAEEVEEIEEEGQMYMVFLEKGKFWTPDEEMKNGLLYRSIINTEGDSEPRELVGQLIDSEAVFS